MPDPDDLEDWLEAETPRGGHCGYCASAEAVESIRRALALQIDRGRRLRSIRDLRVWVNEAHNLNYSESWFYAHLGAHEAELYTRWRSLP